jgi:hypothetical protein
MPVASADLSVTDGLLTVSSTTIQGAAVLEIVVNDPDLSDTTVDIPNGATVTFDGTDYDMNQAVNGKWYLYIVDKSVAALLDADDSTGFEFGILCSDGLGINESTTDLIVGTSVDIYANVLEAHSANWSNAAAGFSATVSSNGSCLDADGMVSNLDSGTTARQDMTGQVLTSAPALSNHDDAPLGNATIDMGQRGHGLNASGYGSWPYIVAKDFSATNDVDYGGDSITVDYGNTDDETSISIANGNPAARAEVHLTITDPALNIDPTGIDKWLFDLSDNDKTGSTVEFATNGTGQTAMSPAELAEMQCVENCRLSSDGEAVLIANSVSGAAASLDVIVMTETAANTGVFESFDGAGEAQFETIAEATADTNTVFSYGGNSVDMIITYNDAEISMDNGGGTWIPGQTATISVNDPDANRNPGSAETLSVGDETVIIPTIKMGTPLTLANGNNDNLSTGTGGTTSAQTDGVWIGDGTGGTVYGLDVSNTTDNSERLRITHISNTGGAIGTGTATTTWINVTTGHTRANIVDLPGTVVLSYDVSAPADAMSATGISVYMTDAGDNATDNSAGLITLTTAGAVKAGVLDLGQSTAYSVKSNDITAGQTWSHAGNAGTNKATINFKFTHAATADMSETLDYAIAADICNFDQNNGSLVHNCIYRLEAVETGDDTGVFEGTVEYLTLNNSTTGGTVSGEHDGNDHEVEGHLGYVQGDALAVVVMDAVTGSDSIRVVYNDTDAFQVATKIGAQLETVTHTGVVELDTDSYGVADIGTITITDPDLNQDSALRDTYQNSTTTFQMSITSAGSSVEQYPFSGTITIIETEANSGVFQGTFKVPDFKGADMQLEYFESKDAASSAVSYYDTATIVSNTGSVSLDRSVYPVPWSSGDLYNGAGSASTGLGAGDITVWITVSDADETDDTLTTASTTAAGTILLKHTNSTGSVTIATAGSIASYDATAGSVAVELGPLSEITMGSSEFEISATISETMGHSTGTNTIQSGDVLQVLYVDTADDAGSSSTQYDSATFDLRTGTLSVDKDVYVMGSDMVITITDPDLNTDSASSQSYTMDIVEWDSAADSSQLLNHAHFSSNPSSIEETGDDTGVFQTVTTIPELTVGDGNPEFGEAVTLTYVDTGLSGETDVLGDTLDVEATFSISNFGALIELDKAVYNWTDTVYITITAPDHNNNSAAEETIGTSALPIQVTSRNGKMCTTAKGSAYYIAAETGPDTGVFEAEVALEGFAHTQHNTPSQGDNCSASDSTAGELQTAGQTDGVSVSYEYTDSVVVVASASIMWNIGEAAFDTSAASAGGSAVLTVTDADENINSDIINSFSVSVFSDSDSGGFTLVMSETDEDTGIFEGTVYFTSDAATSGSNLRVSEGDTVTAEYTDKSLPEPYTDSDTLTVASTLTIGTAFPPLERAPAANARVVDAFGSSVAQVTVDQQVQIAADVSNGQSKDQAFAYLVQVQDDNGVTVSLAWITGSLTAGQSMSPALSWTPSTSGSYTATVFVWESVDNPTALSPTTSVTIDVV